MIKMRTIENDGIMKDLYEVICQEVREDGSTVDVVVYPTFSKEDAEKVQGNLYEIQLNIRKCSIVGNVLSGDSEILSVKGRTGYIVYATSEEIKTLISESSMFIRSISKIIY